MVITNEELEVAIEKAEYCQSATKLLASGSGESELATPTARILKLLVSVPNHELSRIKILKRSWPHVDHFTLDKVMENLIASEAVYAKRDIKGGIIYAMQESVFNQYQRFKQEEEVTD